MPPIVLSMDCQCMRCGLWFEGAGCPVCDRDPNSKPANPPDWFTGDTFTAHAWGVRVPLEDTYDGNDAKAR